MKEKEAFDGHGLATETLLHTLELSAMNNTFRTIILTLMVTLAMAQEPIVEAPPISRATSKEIVVVNVTNGLEGSNAEEAFEIIDELDQSQVEAIIIQIHCLMDTNWDEINLIMAGLGKLTVPTYAFVDSMAVDAGALLAFSTDKIYMAPASIIGGSLILGTGNMKAKLESFNFATARAVAMSKGRDPQLVEAIWNEDVEIRWGDQVISKKGDTLMVEAQDAILEEDGKHFIAECLVRDVYELKENVGLTGRLRFTNADDPKELAGDSPLKSVKMREASFDGKIVVLKIGKLDLINASRFDYMRRILERANREKASAVILDLNTPGGLAWHTGELMMRSMSRLEIPSYAFVNPSAVSAGALIALAADEIYMSPVSAIGAAAVVTSFGDLDDEVEKKITSILVPLCRSVARSNGHDPIYATKFMIPEKTAEEKKKSKEDQALDVEEQDDGTFRLKVKKDEDVGSLLSLAGPEAVLPWNGVEALAKGTATSLEDLIKQEGLTGEIVVAEPLGFEILAQWVTRFSALLLLLAFVAAQVELRMPGFGIFGFISLALFGLFFFGHYAAGKLVGFEMVALFGVGIVLIVAEIFFFPGTLIAGLTGFLCVLVALIYTMTDNILLPSGELSPWQLDFSSVGTALWNLTLALGGAVVVTAISAKFFPESRLFKRLVLQAESSPLGASLENGTAINGEAGERKSLVGAKGRSLTSLRPTGIAMIEGQVLDVVTDGEYVEANADVEVRLIEGSRVVVRSV
ncbi:MAG: membrane-bound serine protease (ClpP class) [Verrucomicrobiales bacterium]